MEEMYKKIRDLRIQAGMSQDVLARAVGYTDRSSIAKIEAGKIDIPQSKIKAFASALHTTTLYLMGETEEDEYVNNDPELTAYLDELKNRKEMRMLFSLAAGATKEDVERTVKIVEAALGKQAKDE